MAWIGSKPIRVSIWCDRHQDRSTGEPSSKPWSAAQATGQVWSIVISEDGSPPCFCRSATGRPARSWGPVLSRRSRIGRKIFEEVVWQVEAGLA
jgi:hypothetical protein